MPTLDVTNLDNEKVGTISLSDDVFGRPAHDGIIWEVVKCQMARRRNSTASTKTRAMVSATGKKPFKQKRTGRARQGTEVAPHQRGGGVAFGPHPHSFTYRVPRKVQRLALCTALSDQVRGAQLRVVKDFVLAEIKTKRLSEVLKRMGLQKALLVDDKDNVKLKLSVRNLPRVTFRPVEGLNLVDLLKYENLLISESSVKRLEGELKS
ncbi:MAG TPA: 50S ribosomal protein L4 [Myxococcota bacterium]|nr:50S ribosomal protein L4 [Myxococcota bacterium]HRY94428.1 50S ribosomal protein L4 [Myxococcota bacterium]